MHATSPLLTDLYQLTMLQGYFDADMTGDAVFEFFVRKLPEQRNFLVAAGLEQAVDYLETLRFSSEDIDVLQAMGTFSAAFLRSLRDFRFTGTVEAMPEGTVFFADEPVLRVVAPLRQAQFVESRLVNILHFQTLIASKAARCVLAAGGRQLIDFGMRRAHGSEAAIMAARASYLAGFTGTATVLAQPRFGIPVFGTMAHSFIEAHDSELEAFEHFVRSHRGPVVLLIDTYDTERGAQRVAELAVRRKGVSIDAVRLDSGDLKSLSVRVRRILDAAGLSGVHIFASGGLDELKIKQLIADQAPIDGFGVGTSLDVSEDHPALDAVYKLQEYAGRPRRKRSSGKATWPGRKQVFRRHTTSGQFDGDCISLESENSPGEPLLRTVMAGGRRVDRMLSLAQVREHAQAELARMPKAMRCLSAPYEYEVDVSAGLRELAKHVDAQFL
jgi:nicotinate phosphoribosyltransferase